MGDPEFSELGQYAIDGAAARLLPLEFCLDRGVAVLDAAPAADAVTIGMLRPQDDALVAELSSRLGRRVRPVQLNAFEVRQAIARIYGLPMEEGDARTRNLELSHDRRIDFEPGQAPSKILDDLLSEAVRRRATDVHIEIYPNDVDLRFRIDGILRQVTTPLSPTNATRVVARIKVLANLDLVERQRAQDGRLGAVYREEEGSRRVDFRISVVPGAYGEDVAIRVLDPARFILDLAALSFQEDLLRRYRRLSRYPNGILLVTGPTGSGKTTTLYATIEELRRRELKIVTAEEPIEREFPKVNQKAVTAHMGFADYLRAFLRQNPDVIMIGEIRDADTAEVAMRAATTGHLILSTMHTSDAAGAIGRLRTLGSADDLISNVLVGILGQRLLRRNCPRCLEESEPPADLVPQYFREAPRAPLRKGRGCDDCEGTGYRGLVAVHELLAPGDAEREAIARGMSVEDLRRMALATGFRPLVEDALDKALQGLTTLEEIARRLPPRYA
jgi:type II secretory ATPase GspE/PulE/Tfp pilus assembly ATPase PilB-like protein